MKLGRLAALLREQALLQIQIAEELEGLSGSNEDVVNAPTTDESRHRLREKRQRRPPSLVRPAGEARFPSSQAFATKLLRERGFR